MKRNRLQFFIFWPAAAEVMNSTTSHLPLAVGHFYPNDPKAEAIIATFDPNDFIYFKYDPSSSKTEETMNISSNDCVKPNVKRIVDKYLDNLFSKRHRGNEPYLRTGNNTSRNHNPVDEFNSLKCNGVSTKKNMIHKSIQTDRLNSCTHKLINDHVNHNSRRRLRTSHQKEVKQQSFSSSFSVTDRHEADNSNNIKYKNCNNIKNDRLKSSKTVNNLINNNSKSNNVLLPQTITAAKKITTMYSNNNVEDVGRKKLHITRIGNVNMNCNNTETRYINIKCNPKLQHIPITTAQSISSLHKMNGTQLLHHSNKNHNQQNYLSSSSSTSSTIAATTSFVFNRNGNNYNYITKIQPTMIIPKRNQTQELKTYSRKSDSNVSAIATEKLNKSIQQLNGNNSLICDVQNCANSNSIHNDYCTTCVKPTSISRITTSDCLTGNNGCKLFTSSVNNKEEHSITLCTASATATTNNVYENGSVSITAVNSDAAIVTCATDAVLEAQ